MKTQIKLCGFKHIEDINYASSLDIDYLGMIFVKDLPRSIDLKVAYDAVKVCKDKNIKTVGVFLNQSASEIFEVLENIDLDIIQLHGSENIRDYDKLNKQLIKTIHISDSIDNNKITNSSKECIYLLDSSNHDLHGGTGKKFDWNNLKTIPCDNLFIAGGLKPDNILELLRSCNPMCVDVSSGIEHEVGRKDHALMLDFVTKVRTYNEK